jgi:predicted acyl esterase
MSSMAPELIESIPATAPSQRVLGTPKKRVSSPPARLRILLLGVLTLLTCVTWRLPEAPAAAGVKPSAYDPGPPLHSGHVRESKHLTMRDGVKIAIDVYLPRGLQDGQKLPTIVLQTRYWCAMEVRWRFPIGRSAEPTPLRWPRGSRRS